MMLPTTSLAMEFSVKRLDLRPVRPPSLHITATGEIISGDTEKLKAAYEAADKTGIRDVLFMFDSPGGSVMESIQMGSYITEIPAIVSAQIGGADEAGAICASACVYAYLGADYRYLPADARIGIHRFGFYGVELDGNQGAALGQALSGLLSEYIRTQRAEPAFFEAISAIDHDDILWVPRSDLEKWRVVTKNVYDETSNYINVDGDIALRLNQIAITGDSSLTLFCTKDGISGLADLHEPEMAAYGSFEIGIDGEWFPIAKWDVTDRSGNRGRVVFHMHDRIAQTAVGAGTIGARVVAPSEYVFFGFEQAVRDGRVAEMIRGCPGALPLAKNNMVDEVGVDYPGKDLTTGGIRGIRYSTWKEICMEHEACRAFSYIKGKSWCWPKSGVSRRTYGRGMISAYKK